MRLLIEKFCTYVHTPLSSSPNPKPRQSSRDLWRESNRYVTKAVVRPEVLGFMTVPAELLKRRMPPAAHAVWQVICVRNWRNEHGETEVRLDTLAKATGLRVTQVRGALSWLMKYGVVEQVETGRLPVGKGGSWATKTVRRVYGGQSAWTGRGWDYRLPQKVAEVVMAIKRGGARAGAGRKPLTPKVRALLVEALQLLPEDLVENPAPLPMPALPQAGDDLDLTIITRKGRVVGVENNQVERLPAIQTPPSREERVLLQGSSKDSENTSYSPNPKTAVFTDGLPTAEILRAGGEEATATTLPLPTTTHPPEGSAPPTSAPSTTGPAPAPAPRPLDPEDDPAVQAFMTQLAKEGLYSRLLTSEARRARPKFDPMVFMPAIPPMLRVERPPPIYLAQGFDDNELVHRLVTAYVGACKAYCKTSSFAKPYPKGKARQSLIQVALFLRVKNIAPAAWAAWSLQDWVDNRSAANDKGIRPAPHLGWVFGMARLTHGAVRGQFRKVESGYMQTKYALPDIGRAFGTRWQKLRLALLSTKEPDEAKAVLQAAFPRGYKPALAQVMAKIEAMQKTIYDEVDAGGWVWGTF